MENAIVRLACDMMHGRQSFNYNDKTYNFSEAQNVLRQALKEACEGLDGKTPLARYKAMRHTEKKLQIFEIIEELVPLILKEGLEGDEFFMNFVDERNLSLGDKNEFFIPDNSTYIVAKIANGIATPDRQRLDHGRRIAVDTSKHFVRAYEEFERFIAGRIDWPALCDKVGKSFLNEIWTDIFAAFSGIDQNTIGLNATYVKGGTYNKATLNTLIEHVEAATGEKAVIVGSKSALALCEGSEKSDSAKESMHNFGFYGNFDGTPMVMIRQKHAPGTDNFLFADNVVYVVAGGDKFIKLVNEGEAIIDDRDFTQNSDETIEYRMSMRWGVALAISGKIGKYTITASE